jgi:hypothetical protein
VHDREHRRANRELTSRFMNLVRVGGENEVDQEETRKSERLPRHPVPPVFGDQIESNRRDCIVLSPRCHTRRRDAVVPNMTGHDATDGEVLLMNGT